MSDKNGDGRYTISGGAPSGGVSGCLSLFIFIGVIFLLIFKIILAALAVAIVAALVAISIYSVYKLSTALIEKWRLGDKRFVFGISALIILCIGYTVCTIAYCNDAFVNTADYHIIAYEQAVSNYISDDMGRNDVAAEFNGYKITSGNIHKKNECANIEYAHINNSFDLLSDEEICKYFEKRPVGVLSGNIASTWENRDSFSPNEYEIKDEAVMEYTARNKIDGGDSYYCLGIYCNGKLYSGLRSKTHILLYLNNTPLCLYNRTTGNILYNTDYITEAAFDKPKEDYQDSDFTGVWTREAVSGFDNYTVELEILQYEDKLLYYLYNKCEDTSYKSNKLFYMSELPVNNTTVCSNYIAYKLQGDKLYEYPSYVSDTNSYNSDLTVDIPSTARYNEYDRLKSFMPSLLAYSPDTDDYMIKDYNSLTDRFCHLYMRRNSDIIEMYKVGNGSNRRFEFNEKVRIKYSDNSYKTAVIKGFYCDSNTYMLLGLRAEEDAPVYTLLANALSSLKSKRSVTKESAFSTIAVTLEDTTETTTISHGYTYTPSSSSSSSKSSSKSSNSSSSKSSNSSSSKSSNSSSSGYSSSRKSSSSYSSKKNSSARRNDPYDVYDYDSGDDFADEWADEFGDGDFDDGYDDAYDYWEDKN